jgi:hypothetical protein
MYNLSELLVVTTVVRHNHLMTLKVGKSLRCFQRLSTLVQRESTRLTGNKAKAGRLKKTSNVCDFCLCVCELTRKMERGGGWGGNVTVFVRESKVSLPKLANPHNENNKDDLSVTPSPILSGAVPPDIDHKKG